MDSLRDVTVHVREQVVNKLDSHYQQNALIDFTALQDACDSSHDRAILILMQLEQRLVTSGVTELSSPPSPTSAKLVKDDGIPKSSDEANAAGSALLNAGPNPAKTLDATPFFPQTPASSPSNQRTPPVKLSIVQQSSRPESSLSRLSENEDGMKRRQVDLYKPMATTVSKPGLFGIGKRTVVERVTSPPENPLIDEYLAETNARSNSRLGSVNTEGSTEDLDHPAHDAWQDYRSPSMKLSHRFSESVSSFGSERPISTSSRECLAPRGPSQLLAQVKILPNEMNGFAGFCKGAWRQQIGDTKRAMEQRVRPGGMYNQSRYWQCKQCKFEGRLVSTKANPNGFDMRVFRLVDGIQFRWEFMFKSHFANQDANSNPTKSVYGCIFCCSEGKDTPTFVGIQAFMDHLREHCERLPAGEVLYRMNCLVGRRATIDEAFDINLISQET